mmetsp:Transcript_37197/g.93440  ORF Transcript_37197/g.93440 Transcript_37197/m.93440 type:complete len:247 (-) Transcript_37197:949-1689(-)
MPSAVEFLPEKVQVPSVPPHLSARSVLVGDREQRSKQQAARLNKAADTLENIEGAAEFNEDAKTTLEELEIDGLLGGYAKIPVAEPGSESPLATNVGSYAAKISNALTSDEAIVAIEFAGDMTEKVGMFLGPLGSIVKGMAQNLRVAKYNLEDATKLASHADEAFKYVRRLEPKLQSYAKKELQVLFSPLLELFAEVKDIHDKMTQKSFLKNLFGGSARSKKDFRAEGGFEVSLRCCWTCCSSGAV